jgi:hypothetical protein
MRRMHSDGENKKGSLGIEQRRTHRVLMIAALCALTLLTLYLRSSGLFRGLEREFVFHPDAPKQVLALNNFLNDIDRWNMKHVTYDGYPYGLNQVDEWIIRPVLAVKYAIVRMTNPGIHQFDVPTHRQLFYWARILRVLYGMCVFGLCLATARYFTRSRLAFLSVGLLMALSPLMTVVTHSATGDIGVDLFCMVTLFALCRYHDRPRLVWIAIAGLCCGLGFACKFQGVLAAFMIASYLLLAMPTFSWRNMGRTVALGAMSLIFLVGGIFLGSPTLRETPKTTWRDMRGNMVYVKNDAATPEFLEKSFLGKITYGLTHNGPSVCEALGLGIVLLSVVALGVSLWRWWRSTRSENSILSERSKSSLHIAALGFALFAGLLSTALKPTIQPFHYSYLVPILCLAAGLVLDMLWQSRNRSVRWLGLVVLLCTVGDLAARSWRENYFWRRDDARGDAYAYPGDTFRKPAEYFGDHAPEDELKRFELHDLGLPVFRNRPSVVWFPDAAFLKSIRILPVPTVTFPQTSRWIFMDGPIMPRNDRMFEVAGGRTVKKDVVFYETPQPMTFGIRVGDTPSTVRISAGGVTKQVHVTPHRQTVFTIEPKRWVKSSSNGLDVNIVAVEAQSSMGFANISVMTSEQERQHFSFFGGVTRELPYIDSFGTNTLAAWVGRTRFVENHSEHRFIGGHKGGVLSLDLHLPAGAYLLTCDVEGHLQKNKLSVAFADASGFFDAFEARQVFDVKKGYNTLSIPFTKAFAPFSFKIPLVADPGSVSLIRWSVRPQPEIILKAITDVNAGEAGPEWLAHRRAATEQVDSPNVLPESGVRWKNGLHLTALRLPSTLVSGERCVLESTIDVQDAKFDTFDQLAFLVHVIDANGDVAAVFDHPLTRTQVGDEGLHIPVVKQVPAGLPPGPCQLWVGLYSVQTQKRYALAGKSVRGRDVKRDAVHVADLRIE